MARKPTSVATSNDEYHMLGSEAEAVLLLDG